MLFRSLIFSGIGSATVGALAPRSPAIIGRGIALLTTLAVAGLLTPLVITWARAEATDMRILVSVLLLAPSAFCMGMMFPLGLSIWRRHSELLPFFWSANGITSMLASVLGMALSIQFGIANTYALGVGFYVVGVFMVVTGRRANNAMDVSVATPAQDLVPDSVAPSIQPTEVELDANIDAAESLRSSRLARTDEVH